MSNDRVQAVSIDAELTRTPDDYATTHHRVTHALDDLRRDRSPEFIVEQEGEGLSL